MILAFAAIIIVALYIDYKMKIGIFRTKEPKQCKHEFSVDEILKGVRDTNHIPTCYHCKQEVDLRAEIKERNKLKIFNEHMKQTNKEFAEQWKIALGVYEDSYVSVTKNDPNQIEAFCHGYILGLKSKEVGNGK